MEDFFSFETKDQHIFFRNENDKKKKNNNFLMFSFTMENTKENQL